MKRIKQSTFDRIFDAATIYEVVSDYIPLKKIGANYTCCCPFHNERTASFVVFTGTNTYKCFGCGEQGKPVSFLMKHDNLTFPEAIRALGKKYSIEVEDEGEETEEEIATRLRRETMFLVADHVAKAYRKEFETSKEAQDYAYARWDKDFCAQMGIGFAPASGSFVGHLPESPQGKKDLGMLNDNGSDFFRNRIVIPIRDRFSRVIGFTCRRMDGEKKCKYLNTRSSEIYDKSRSLFGIDGAWTAARTEKMMYLVEGAPDCMRLQSIGVMNVVADLGTSWTDDHFAQILKLTDTICFIPDDDTLKPGQQFATGTAAVMKAAHKAMELGFTVMIKEIPRNEHGEKQDPDSYFLDKAIFERTPTEDYIPWYAYKIFAKAYSAREKDAALQQVAGLLSLVSRRTLVDAYIQELQKLYGNKRLWKDAMAEAKKEMEEQRSRKVISKEDEAKEMDQQYGFHIEHNKYYSVTDSGSIYEWSNFILIPKYLIKDSNRPQRLFVIKNEFNASKQVTFDPADLVSIQQFCIKVEGLGNFIWKATNKELTKLKSYLFKDTEEAVPVKQLGWQLKHEVFAFGNGVCNDDGFVETDDDGIVRLGKKGIFYIAANSKTNRLDNKHFAFQHQFVHDTHAACTLQEYTSQLFKVYGNNGRVAFVFLLATIFRDVVIRQTRSFPILNLFGPKGSGKSDLAQAIMAFFIKEHKGSSVTSSSIAALGETIASVANACVLLEEYRNDLDPRKVQLLKGIWDGIGREKMNMDNSGTKETTAVDCGAILSGQEMPTADIALFSRLVHLSFPTSEFTFEEKREHKTLMAMANEGLTHLTIEILSHRSYFERFFPSMHEAVFVELSKEMENAQIEARVFNNWTTIVAVYKTLEAQLGVDLSLSDLRAICIQGMKTQNIETKTSSELGGFWNVVNYLVGEGDLIFDGDFRISKEQRISVKSNRYEWPCPFLCPRSQPLLHRGNNHHHRPYPSTEEGILCCSFLIHPAVPALNTSRLPLHTAQRSDTLRYISTTLIRTRLLVARNLLVVIKRKGISQSAKALHILSGRYAPKGKMLIETAEHSTASLLSVLLGPLAAVLHTLCLIVRLS